MSFHLPPPTYEALTSCGADDEDIGPYCETILCSYPSSGLTNSLQQWNAIQAKIPSPRCPNRCSQNSRRFQKQRPSSPSPVWRARMHWQRALTRRARARKTSQHSFSVQRRTIFVSWNTTAPPSRFADQSAQPILKPPQTLFLDRPPPGRNHLPGRDSSAAIRALTGSRGQMVAAEH